MVHKEGATTLPTLANGKGLLCDIARYYRTVVHKEGATTLPTPHYVLIFNKNLFTFTCFGQTPAQLIINC